MARILLVEDDLFVARATKRILERAKHAVIVAPDGETVLRLLRTGASFDLVIIDYTLAAGGMTGGTLVIHLKLGWPELPVMFLSGYSSIDVDPGIPFMQKPYNVPELLELVDKLTS